MNIAAVWLFYIVLVLILWGLFWYPAEGDSSGLTALFYALLIGFLAVYLVTPSIDLEELSDEEKAWFNALLALTIILPFVVIGLMIAYIYQRMYKVHECGKNKVQTENLFNG